MIKKILRALLYVLVFLLVVGTVLFFVYDKPLPTGEAGPRAEALAQKMQAAIGQEAWEQTRYVEWTFRGGHHYVWDKYRHVVEVKWDNHRVLLNPTVVTGLAFTDGQASSDAELIQTANAYFINDAFWLNAPAQLAGNREVLLQAVDLEEGGEGLLVTYQSGGVTPGDSYLWILDDTGLPTAWQMWVGILPIGGLEFSWENWEELPTGAKVSTLHNGPFAIPITNLKTYQTAEQDLFEALGR